MDVVIVVFLLSISPNLKTCYDGKFDLTVNFGRKLRAANDLFDRCRHYGLQDINYRRTVNYEMIYGPEYQPVSYWDYKEECGDTIGYQRWYSSAEDDDLMQFFSEKDVNK